MGINGVSSYANTYTYGNVKNENVKPSKNSEKNYYAGYTCLLYTSPSPRDSTSSRMPSSA